MGALILKETLGVTDDEVVQGLMFDIRYQYALHTTSFDEQPLSDRTLSRFRARCLAYETETGGDLIHNCITGLAKEFSEFMGIRPNMQRMDSLMVAANIRNLSLLELFYTCVANLAKVMVQRELQLPDAQNHYVEKDDYNYFIYHNRKIDAAEQTIAVMHDAEKLLECINGKHPYDTHYDKVNERCDARFALCDCQKCPYQKECKPRLRKNSALKEISWKAVNRGKQRRYMKTDEFRELAHFRNGVESIQSLLRRRYKVDKIPAHGKKETRLHFGFKIGALNFQKLLNYYNSLEKCGSKQEVA